MKFLTRHPFFSSLLKLVAYILVGWNTLFACLVVAVLLLGAVFTVPPATEHLGDLEPVYGEAHSFNDLLAIPVTGEIVGDGATSLASFDAEVTSGYEVKQKLYEAVDHDEIKGVVLEINSPGGTIYGAHAIADGVEYYRSKTKRPVFAHIEGIGASGAYWAAVSADRVVADYGSDVGSIGVVMGPFKYYNTVLSEQGGLFDGGVMTQNGIQSVSITAGKSKDLGDPYRQLTTDEQRQLQQSVNNDYDQFVQYVSQRRDITAEVLRNQVGAMIYDNKTAQNLKLIDQSGSREDVYAALAKAAKVEGEDYRVVRQATAVSFLASLLGAVTHAPTHSAKSPASLCALTRSPLVHYGSVTELCGR